MQQFEQCVVEIDGALLSMNQEGSLEMDGDPVTVDTIPLQFAGVTAVPKTSMLTLKNAQPPTGFEFDPFKSFANTTEHKVRIQFLGSGKAYLFKGYVTKPKIDWGATKSVSNDYGFKGEISEWT